MIDYIKGELSALTPAVAVVETCGVGWALNISLNTFSALQGQVTVKLFVHEQLVVGGRDDSVTLYGFVTVEERELFRMLLSVSGIGANTARMILSSLSAAELCRAIGEGDERLLKSIKGIGPKAAQRIILELKDKLEGSGLPERLHILGGSLEAIAAIDPEVRAAAVSALTMLGFAPAPTAKVVSALLRDDPTLTVEQVVKKALKMM